MEGSMQGLEEPKSVLKSLLLRLHHVLADPKLFLTSIPVVVLFLVLFTFLELQISPNGPGAITSFQLAFSDERAFELLGEWGPRGQDMFKVALLIDMLFPVAYSLLLGSGIAYFSKKRVDHEEEVPSGVLIVFSLPFLAAIADWAENFLQFVMLSDTTFIDDTTTMLVGIYAVIKFLFLGIAGLYLVYLIITTMSQRQRVKT